MMNMASRKQVSVQNLERPKMEKLLMVQRKNLKAVLCSTYDMIQSLKYYIALFEQDPAI
jgi:hypothetical protein